MRPPATQVPLRAPHQLDIPLPLAPAWADIPPSQATLSPNNSSTNRAIRASSPKPRKDTIPHSSRRPQTTPKLSPRVAMAPNNRAATTTSPATLRLPPTSQRPPVLVCILALSSPRRASTPTLARRADIRAHRDHSSHKRPDIPTQRGHSSHRLAGRLSSLAASRVPGRRRPRSTQTGRRTRKPLEREAQYRELTPIWMAAKESKCSFNQVLTNTLCYFAANLISEPDG